MKTYVHFLYLTEYFSEWEMFQTEVVEEFKTHILYSIHFFWKLYHLWDNMEKYGRARQSIGDKIVQCMHIACWITKATHTLRLCNTYCFSMATNITWTLLDVMFICTVPVLLKLFSLCGYWHHVVGWHIDIAVVMHHHREVTDFTPQSHINSN